MKYGLVFAAAILLSACQEAQPPHDVTDLPSDNFTIEVLSNDLVKPWGVAPLPGEGYLVTEIGGTIKLVSGNKTNDLEGLPDDIFVNGQGGLLGVVLAPDFETSREVYISYVYGTADHNGTAIYKSRFDGAALRDGQVIFKASPKQAGSHFGGKMVFLPDDTLVLTLGDGFAFREKAQTLDTHLGKIIRINRDGSPANNNPFIRDENARPEIYSYGHRNVQGLAYDLATGSLWSHEHGPRGGDELNLIKQGANYGWPLATTGRDYNGARITPYDKFEGTEPFVKDWVPSIAPSGLVIYRGDLFEDWQGDALIGALAGKSIWRVDLSNNKAVGEERLLADRGQRVRDVKQDYDGAVLALTESADGGELLRITPKN